MLFVNECQRVMLIWSQHQHTELIIDRMTVPLGSSIDIRQNFKLITRDYRWSQPDSLLPDYRTSWVMNHFLQCLTVAHKNTLPAISPQGTVGTPIWIRSLGSCRLSLIFGAFFREEKSYKRRLGKQKWWSFHRVMLLKKEIQVTIGKDVNLKRFAEMNNLLFFLKILTSMHLIEL